MCLLNGHNDDIMISYWCVWLASHFEWFYKAQFTHLLISRTRRKNMTKMLVTSATEGGRRLCVFTPVCLFVCLFVCEEDISKKLWTYLDKNLGDRLGVLRTK